ncbi:MAG TPA: hypothetical protein VLG16_03055 [Candidatus Saccharimonadales bacterium]|nr:hypothetical protein [Candidatus Saccharimonadales bacterium]
MINEQLVTKIRSYQPSISRLEGLRDTSILCVVGISGAGKDTVTNKLLRDYPNAYTRFISHTTRPPRLNHGKLEQDGHDYYFINFKQAEYMLDNHDLIEANLYSGNMYGTGITELKRAHDERRTLVTDVDVNGAAHLIKILPQGKPVFILPPSFEVWQQRFLIRYNGKLNQVDYQKRMRTAFNEITHALNHSYYYLVINDDLDVATQAIHDISNGEVTNRRPPAAVEVAQSILQDLSKII